MCTNLKGPPLREGPNLKFFSKLNQLMHHIFLLYLLIGLPKAAIIAHSRLFKGGCLMRLGDFDENDIVYTPLPLYHSAAGVIGLCGIIEAGIFLLYITSPLLFQVTKCILFLPLTELLWF